MREKLWMFFNKLKISFSKTSLYLSKKTSLAFCVLFYDACAALLTIPLSLYLRVGEEINDYSIMYIAKNSVIFSLIFLAIYLTFHTYQIMWRYLESGDIIKISFSIFVSTLIYWPFMNLISLDEEMPRLILFMSIMVLHGFMLAPRFVIYLTHNRHRLKLLAKPPLLILGTNQDVKTWLKQAFHSEDFPYNPIGLITYHDEEMGSEIHDVPIVTTMENLEEYLKHFPITNGYIVVVEYPLKGMDHFIRIISRHDITLLRVPKSFDVMHAPFDEMSLSHLFKEPAIELSRNEKKFFKDKSILICGAGSFLYQKFLEILLDIPCKHLHILDQSAGTLEELRKRCIHKEEKISYHLGNIIDQSYLNHLLKHTKPDIVFMLPMIQPKLINEKNTLQIIRTYIASTPYFFDACEANNIKLVCMLGEKNFEKTSINKLLTLRKDVFVFSKVSFKRLFVHIENLLGSAYAQTSLMQRQINRGGPIVLNSESETGHFLTPQQMSILLLKSVFQSYTTDDQNDKIYHFNLNNSVRLSDLTYHILHSQGLHSTIDIHYHNTLDSSKIENSFPISVHIKNKISWSPYVQEEKIGHQLSRNQFIELLAISKECNEQKVFQFLENYQKAD